MGAGGAALGAGAGALGSGGDPEAIMQGAMMGGAGGAALGGMGQLARIGLGDVGEQAVRSGARGLGQNNMAAAYKVILNTRMAAQEARRMGYVEEAARLEQEAAQMEQRLAGGG